MKAITLWQPWASLLACGAKQFETRSWATKYRGPTAIHAAAIFPLKAISDIPLDVVCEMRRSLKESGILTLSTDFREIPRGKVIATAELVNCHRMGIDPKTHRIALYDNRGYQTSVSLCSNELLFGDWTSGRYAWELANVQLLTEPVTAKGKQGLWNWNENDPKPPLTTSEVQGE